MNEKKLGPLLLSGLMIGPVLGSGIILLPTLVYDTSGDYAIFAWFSIMMVTFLFSMLFAKISIKYPGDGGVTISIYKAFGEKYRKLASIYFMLAASIGPIAVLMTAAKYVERWGGFTLNEVFIGVILMAIGVLILLNDVSFIGRASFIFSTFAVVILFSGGAVALWTNPPEQVITTSFDLSSFGGSLLLLFWMLVGWEIVGNYSGEVRNPDKTIKRAVLYSASIVTVVSLTVAAAVQWSGKGAVTDLSVILAPLFGKFALPLISLVTLSLCMTTYILVTGGVSRLVASQQNLPAFIKFRNRKGVPIGSLMLLGVIHMIVFTLVYFEMVTLDLLVKTADVFFIGNAFIAVASVFVNFKGRLIRVTAGVISVVLVVILLFSSKLVLGFALLVALGTIMTTSKDEGTLEAKAIHE
ncbi:amino acid permease [Pontibacillus chungwhensis BH030062]|uniref:Amino acid permease n=1 Tax=Pontibacillus chungwhensis BH030062 TaxID=1385513 RepID=A0A0A2UV36_9BACI|nr:amino acid permease [Pontibacillus chungwhensis]KGP91784.1 amino acid permease [Pontibacillus chungwhensis BH030062]